MYKPPRFTPEDKDAFEEKLKAAGIENLEQETLETADGEAIRVYFARGSNDSDTTKLYLLLS